MKYYIARFKSAFIPYAPLRKKVRKKILFLLTGKKEKQLDLLLQRLDSLSVCIDAISQQIKENNNKVSEKIKENNNKVSEKIDSGYCQLSTKIEYQNQIFKSWFDSVVDVRQLPKATGKLRQLQIADTEILRILADIFAKHNLSYWLDFGTLLGAKRHKGFVPWDDDMDIAMLRRDYDRLFEILDDEFTDTPLYYYGKDQTFQNWDTFIRIRCQNTSLNIDIFPYDQYFKKVTSDAEKEVLSKKMKEGRQFYNRHYPIKDGETKEKLTSLRQIFADYTFNMINKHKMVSDPEATIFKGIENWAYEKSFFYDYDTIYPLRKMRFEEYSFFVPNKTEKYLEGIYGDYMKIPYDLNRHGSVFVSEIPENIDEMISILKSITVKSNER